jgi:integrase
LARTIRDTNLDSRAARSRLKTHSEPYWRTIDRGAHLGYYRGKKAGSWTARLYAEGRYHKAALGLADDVSDADGVGILSFSEAQAAARRFFESKRRQIAGLEPDRTGPYTVAAALDDYHSDRYPTVTRPSLAVLSSIETHLKPALGNVALSALTTKRIKDWLNGFAASPILARPSRIGRKRRDIIGTDGQRRRKATANRVYTVLRSALNHAFREGRIDDDRAWRKVKPFRDVELAKIRYLDPGERVRLVNACSGKFRDLARGALLTGARYGELTRMIVSDFDASAGTISVWISKSGKPRHIVLTDEGKAFFEALTAGLNAGDLIFTNENGTAWKHSEQHRPIKAACEIAKIKPAISFHILRHTHGAALAMGGAPLPVIAKQLGHADTRITEKHYAHLAPNYVADTIRASLPTLGIHQPTNVTALKPRS